MALNESTFTVKVEYFDRTEESLTLPTYAITDRDAKVDDEGNFIPIE